MKLYISYYGNYVSIVEGIYNNKKDKYNIKSTKFLSEEDVDIDINDKYSLLKEALRLTNFKAKNVVFSLNTRDVIIKSNQISKMNPKDLDGIMNNEMYEMMSLDYDRYSFSYEVTDEKVVDDKEELNLIIAAILNEELEVILDIFKEFKLNVECIDTISTSYGRLLKKIEYKDVMILNIGRYGSLVNIYKEDSLFIYDNIPVRVNKHANYSVALSLVEEVKGLMNFYSSRNYGKNVDKIIIVGESNTNNYIINDFKDSFSSDIVVGIENLFDIKEDIQGHLQECETSLVCDILGSMSIVHDKKGYSCMNLLPLKLRNKQNKKDIIKRYALVTPLVIGILLSPNFIINDMELKVKQDTQLAQDRLDEIMNRYEDIENIDNKIDKAKEEIGIYDMLSSKKIEWGDTLSVIDKNIPFRSDLTNINVYYNSELDKDEENQEEQSEKESETGESSEAELEVPIYDQIPNIIELEGIANTSDKVGQFVYSLNKTGYFDSVRLKNSSKDKENGGYVFHIVLGVRKDAIYSK